MEDTLDLRDLAKYPFLKESQEYVSSKTGTFDDFLRSNYGRVLVNHAAERVIRAIRSQRYVRGERIADPEKDLFSYALSRVIVSCIKERGITERHTRYEASRASSFLKNESELKRQLVSSKIGFNLNSDKMNVVEYIELTSILKDDHWRLVNRELSRGLVQLRSNEIDELVRERVRIILQKQLPLSIPLPVCESLKTVTDEIGKAFQEQVLRQYGTIDESSFPPCIAALITAITAGTNIPHQGRFALTAFLNAIGMDSQGIVELYCRAPDFDISKTMYQVEHIMGARGTEYTAPSCATMRTYGFCVKRETICGNVNHPLNYYAIKKKKREQKDKREVQVT